MLLYFILQALERIRATLVYLRNDLKKTDESD